MLGFVVRGKVARWFGGLGWREEITLINTKVIFDTKASLEGGRAGVLLGRGTSMVASRRVSWDARFGGWST